MRLFKRSFVIFLVLILSQCASNFPNRFSLSSSSIQTVYMGEFIGVDIMEIASLTFPESKASLTHTIDSKEGPTEDSQSMIFDGIDQDNFSQSIIKSLKRSDVRVLPSAQMKLHIDFTRVELQGQNKDKRLHMAANITVSRNGITTKKFIEVTGKARITIGSSKDDAIKGFIQELGNVISEQPGFKR